MADVRTERSLRTRRRLKFWLFPILFASIGLGAKIIYDWTPFAALFNALQTVTSLLSVAPEEALQTNPQLAWALGWIAAPIGLGALAFFIAKIPPFPQLIDRAFPDPPPFVLSDLQERRRAGMPLSKIEPLPFAGREQDVAILAAMFDLPESFRWRAVVGQSGIGKTRLAIEWLAAAQARGWDVGIADPADVDLLRNWKARKPTALVIDEARSRWDKALGNAVEALTAGADQQRPVRLLILEQVDFPIVIDDAPMRDTVKMAEILPALQLRPMPEKAVVDMLAGIDIPAPRIREVVEASAGRPRTAIMMALAPDARNLAEAKFFDAIRLVPELATASGTPDDRLSIPLILSALAGPIAIQAVRDLVPSYDPGLLMRIFNVGREELSHELPPFEPKDLGMELAIRLIAKLDSPLQQKALSIALDHAPNRIELQLREVWRNLPDYFFGEDLRPGLLSTLEAMQHNFDRRWPETMTTLQADIKRASLDVRNPQLREQALAVIDEVVSARPFDRRVRHHEALGIVDAVSGYGEAQQWDAMEHWGERLLDLARQLPADPQIGEAAATAIYTAILHYGAIRQWGELERWGRQIDLMTGSFPGDRAIKFRELGTISNAIKFYCEAGLLDEIILWEARLDTASSQFQNELKFCAEISSCSVNAILAYGENRQWQALERWGHRLAISRKKFPYSLETQTSELMGTGNAIKAYARGNDASALARWEKRHFNVSDHFKNNRHVRFYQTMAAVHAIDALGLAKNWDAVERWGERLSSITLGFHDDSEIRLQEAQAIYNAMRCYELAQDWNAQEIWGRRLNILMSEFPDHQGICLYGAKAAVNAIIGYGQTKQFDALERWGERLDAICRPFPADPQIGLEIMRAAVSASLHTGNARRWDCLERWGDRITRVASALSEDVNIRHHEAMATFNAILTYGAVQQLEPMERWGERLAAIVHKFKNDPQVGLEEAKSSHCALGAYGDHSNAANWRKRFAFVAQRFPDEAAIQYYAKQFGIGFAEQSIRNFPFGRTI